MKPRQKKALKALAIFLLFAFAQVYVVAALPDPTPGGVPQQTLTARLTTRNNQPITVNGNAAGTGATILTGATIETPDQVGATIDLGDAGVIELQPNSKIQLDFDANGNVRVKVLRGCVMSRRKSNVLPGPNQVAGETELYTETESLKTDKKRRNVGGCLLPNGQLGSFGAGGLSGAALAGIGVAAAGGTLIGVTLARGGTTSTSTPPNGN
jgi:hypothetical protein